MAVSKKRSNGTSLALQMLRLCASNAGDAGLIPGQGTKTPHAGQPKEKKKKERNVLRGRSGKIS